MITTDLIIVGLNPHSIGLTILAKYCGLNSVVIDSSYLDYYPITPLFDYTRREEINIDVLSSIDIPLDLEQYKLSRFLGYASTECTYKHYHAYIHFLVSQLEMSGYVKFIKEDVILISKNSVTTSSEKRLSSKAVVICKEYSSISSSIVNIEPLNIYSHEVNNIQDSSICIWGSNDYQLIALLHLLSQGNRVKWVLDKEYKVTQLALPSETEWGYKNAYSNYYKDSIKDLSIQQHYIKSVTKWQPSISPIQELYIHKYVENNTLQIIYKSNTPISNIKESISSCNYLVSGRELLSIKDIPYLKKPLSHKLEPQYPYLNPTFMDTEGIYYMGNLASRLDGLRQTSLVSIGITAQAILKDIQDVR